MSTTDEHRRAIMDLLPQVLRGWSRGWGGLPTAAAAVGLTPPAYFLLRALIQERDAGTAMTRGEMERDLFNPYSTIWPILDHLPALVAAGYITQQDDGATVTAAGRQAFGEIERKKDAYIGTLAPIPLDELVRLANTLQAIADRIWAWPEPQVKAHHARPRRTPPPAGAAPMVRLLHAVYCLWMARDDAHNAVWRGAGFTGPAFDLLTRVWAGEGEDLGALTEAVRQSQRPDDVRSAIDCLVAGGYLTIGRETIAITENGRAIREAIETETNSIYFAPWPPLTAAAVGGLREMLSAVIAGLPT
jgi:hypothetical protein